MSVSGMLQCSVSCGGGQQQRQVSCVSDLTLDEVPSSQCEKSSKPETLRKCNMQECKTNAGLCATSLFDLVFDFYSLVLSTKVGSQS